MKLLAKLWWLLPGNVSFTENPEQLKMVRDGFIQRDKTYLPEEYVKKAVVIEDSSSEIMLVQDVIGACCFIEDKNHFRTPKLPANGFVWHVKPHAVEMNGLWIYNSVPELTRLKFYLRICDEIFKRYADDTPIFFSYEINKKGLSKFYEIFTEEIVYEGEVNSVPGMDQNKQYIERICVFTPNYLKEKLFYLVGKRVKRMFV